MVTGYIGGGPAGPAGCGAAIIVMTITIIVVGLFGLAIWLTVRGM